MVVKNSKASKPIHDHLVVRRALLSGINKTLVITLKMALRSIAEDNSYEFFSHDIDRSARRPSIPKN